MARVAPRSKCWLTMRGSLVPSQRYWTRQALSKPLVRFGATQLSARARTVFVLKAPCGGLHAVEICINASKLHPTGRLPHLQVGGSPWFNVHGGDAAVNRSIEAAEVAKWRTEFEQSARLLAAANAKFGSHVVIGCAQFDVESWSWSPNYQGVA